MRNVTKVNEKCYSSLKSVGKGSYGVVFSSMVDKKVAILKDYTHGKQISDSKHVLCEIRLI